MSKAQRLLHFFESTALVKSHGWTNSGPGSSQAFRSMKSAHYLTNRTRERKRRGLKVAGGLAASVLAAGAAAHGLYRHFGN